MWTDNLNTLLGGMRERQSSSIGTKVNADRGLLPRRYLDLGSYAEWDEEKRIEFLTRELEGKRPLIPTAMPMTNDVREVSASYSWLILCSLSVPSVLRLVPNPSKEH